MRVTIVCLAILVLFGSSGALAQFGANISDQAQLNGNTAFEINDTNPQLTTDGQGNWIAIWHSGEIDFVNGRYLETDILIARSTDNGVTWTYPAPLNNNAGYDTGSDSHPQLTTDGQGNWIAVWVGIDTTTIPHGTDGEILFARSTDDGITWTYPEPLNANNGTDSALDKYPQLKTDGQGNWVAVWDSEEPDISGGIGSDGDILVARSTNNGVTWTYPAPLNGSASSDSGIDYWADLSTDESGNWVAVWYSQEPNIAGGIGTDPDILVARSADNGMTWTYPAPLNRNAGSDSEQDSAATVATDGRGNWVAVWHSNEPNIAGGIGIDGDALVARSTDNGMSWTYPEPLDTEIAMLHGTEGSPRITTDGLGNWVVTWTYYAFDFGGPIEWDGDLLVVRSTDNGVTWTYPEALNSSATTDSWSEANPRLATDRQGHWVAVWERGVETDLFTAHFVFCDPSANQGVYGKLLFPSLCTLDASALTQDVYGSTTRGINKGASDAFYLSSDGMSFAPLVIDDAVHINGASSGLGPYSFQPSVPPFIFDVPIEHNLVPLPAHDISSVIPPGQSEVLFELLDTQREVYGNTAVYFVRDCGIYLEKASPTAIDWVSHDVEVGGVSSELRVVSGYLNELRDDRGFSRACEMGTFLDTTQAFDSRRDPPSNDGYYYVVNGTCAQSIGYGFSSVAPDPRESLGGEPVCSTVFEPDLVVSSIGYAPTLPSSQDTITVVATVRNAGTDVAPASILNFRIGAETLGVDFAVPSLGPGATQSFQRQLSGLAPGAYDIVATADYLEDVTESDEANNERLETMWVYDP